MSSRKKQLQKEGSFKENALFALEVVMFPKCSTSFKPCYCCKRDRHHHNICPTKFEISDEIDIKKTSVNRYSPGADQPPQSDDKNSESATVVSNTFTGEKEYCYRFLKL